MTWGLVAVGGAALVSAGVSYYSSEQAKGAAGEASAAQLAAGDRSIEEARRQFDSMQSLLAPYTEAGTKALAGQSALAGLSGTAEQQAAIQGIAGGPQFQALSQQGENAILQNASATGGLRGGNTQGALAQFRPQLLSQLIDQQYSRLGGLTNVGQNAAAGVGNASQAASNQIIDQYGQQGSAVAGNALARGNANIGFANQIGGGISQGLASLGTLNLMGKI